MSELKTLKELPWTHLNKEMLYSERDLKQEAIKWIKRDIETFGKYNGRQVNLRFILFFNITEDDLDECENLCDCGNTLYSDDEKRIKICKECI